MSHPEKTTKKTLEIDFKTIYINLAIDLMVADLLARKISVSAEVVGKELAERAFNTCTSPPMTAAVYQVFSDAILEKVCSDPEPVLNHHSD